MLGPPEFIVYGHARNQKTAANARQSSTGSLVGHSTSHISCSSSLTSLSPFPSFLSEETHEHVLRLPSRSDHEEQQQEHRADHRVCSDCGRRHARSECAQCRTCSHIVCLLRYPDAVAAASCPFCGTQELYRLMTPVQTSESQTQTLTTHKTVEAAVTDSPPTDSESESNGNSSVVARNASQTGRVLESEATHLIERNHMATTVKVRPRPTFVRNVVKPEVIRSPTPTSSNKASARKGRCFRWPRNWLKCLCCSCVENETEAENRRHEAAPNGAVSSERWVVMMAKARNVTSALQQTDYVTLAEPQLNSAPTTPHTLTTTQQQSAPPELSILYTSRTKLEEITSNNDFMERDDGEFNSNGDASDSSASFYYLSHELDDEDESNQPAHLETTNSK